MNIFISAINDNGYFLLLTNAFIGILVLIFILSMMSAIFKTKSTRKKALSITTIVLSILVLLSTSMMQQEDKNEKKTQSNYSITGYNVKLNVGEDNVVEVTETIDINVEGYIHGIFRFIPRWLEYTNKDGKTTSRRAEISNLTVSDDQYEISEVKGKSKIKIGDKYNYLTPGTKKRYIISYQYNLGKDPYKGYDEFIFHAFGDFWTTPINNGVIEITMPKDFDISKIRFFNDKYRKENLTNNIDYDVYNNKVTAYINRTTNSITVDIELPDGYFTGTSSSYGMVSLIITVFIIGLGVLSIINWFLFGKDEKKYVETVEFYAPDNLDASEIGYIYNKETGKKLAVALIVELASKQYIKIDEIDKVGLTITNLCNLDLDKELNRKITVTLVKEYEPGKDKEKLDELFKGNKTIIIEDKFQSFYDNYDKYIRNKEIIVERDTIKDYSDEELEKLKYEYLAKYSKNKTPLTEQEKLVYDQLFAKSNSNLLSSDKDFYVVFNELDEKLENKYGTNINDQTSDSIMFLTAISAYMSAIMYMTAYSYIKDLNPELSFLYIASVISVLIQIFFTTLMRRKTPEGEKILAKINGFKHYIEVAEKDEINKQVEKNPNYFFDILPYAYVLGISKKWIKKFENIPMPEIDRGSFNYFDTDSLDYISDNFHQPTYSSSGSGCSSCGGGCSSCGGGCSSCGGGGSW